MTAVAETLVLLVEIYFGVGLLFAILFAWRGAAAIDPAARGATIGFRLLIVPASALLWPLLLRRWVRRAPPPLEHNAHRDAAADREASVQRSSAPRPGSLPPRPPSPPSAGAAS
jgi:hypothetical protein